MRIVCNYSDQLLELIDEDKVKVDMIKLGLFDMYEGAYDKAKAYRPVMIHGVGYDERASMKNLDLVNWNRVNDIIKEFNVPHIGYHFIAIKQDFEAGYTEEKVKLRMIETTKTWKNNIKVPFLIENLAYSEYYGSKGFIEISVNPEFMTQVCTDLDIGLILDTSHAKVTARHYNMNLIDYIRQFPLDRVKEIHVNGTLDTPEGYRDKHLELADEDYKIVEWLVDNSSSEYITLEYGGPGEHYAYRSDKEALRRQLERLNKIVY